MRLNCSSVRLGWPSGPFVDQRARGARGIVEQRLGPMGAGIVHVDGDSGGLDRRKPVMIVERMKQFRLQHGQKPACGIARQTRCLAVDRVVVGFRLAPRAGHRFDAVGTQHMQLAHLAAQTHRFEIGVAGRLQMSVPGGEELRAALLRIGVKQQIEQRMGLQLVRAFIEEPRHGACAFRDHAHRAIGDSVRHHPFAGERRIVARRPMRTAGKLQRDQSRTLRFGRAALRAPLPSEPAFEHFCLPMTHRRLRLALGGESFHR